MAASSLARASSRSAAWVSRNSCRALTSAYSSMAAGLTSPSARRSRRRRATSCGIPSATSGSSSRAKCGFQGDLVLFPEAGRQSIPLDLQTRLADLVLVDGVQGHGPRLAQGAHEGVGVVGLLAGVSDGPPPALPGRPGRRRGPRGRGPLHPRAPRPGQPAPLILLPLSPPAAPGAPPGRAGRRPPRAHSGPPGPGCRSARRRWQAGYAPSSGRTARPSRSTVSKASCSASAACVSSAPAVSDAARGEGQSRFRGLLARLG